MAAVRQQGGYLGSTLIGFTALAAGLVVGKILGGVVAIAGLGLLVYSAIGFRRVKGLTSTY